MAAVVGCLMKEGRARRYKYRRVSRDGTRAYSDDFSRSSVPRRYSACLGRVERDKETRRTELTSRSADGLGSAYTQQGNLKGGASPQPRKALSDTPCYITRTRSARRVACSPRLPQLSTGSLQAPASTTAGGGSDAEEVVRRGRTEHEQQLRAEQAQSSTSTHPQLGRVSSLVSTVLDVSTWRSHLASYDVRQRSK